MSGSLSEASLELPPPWHSPSPFAWQDPALLWSQGLLASASHSLVPPPSRPRQLSVSLCLLVVTVPLSDPSLLAPVQQLVKPHANHICQPRLLSEHQRRGRDSHTAGARDLARGVASLSGPPPSAPAVLLSLLASPHVQRMPLLLLRG